jgi:hypothetical protein
VNGLIRVEPWAGRVFPFPPTGDGRHNGFSRALNFGDSTNLLRIATSPLADRPIWMEEIMSRESRMLAGILLVVLPTVMYGGLVVLSSLTRNLPGYNDNPLRHNLWRAGHAHAGVYLVLSLVMLRYVDEAVLSPFWKWVARTGAPIAAILIPAGFFLSVVSTTATEPNGLLNLAYVGAAFLAAAVLSLGVGLIRAARRTGGVTRSL